MKDDVRHLLERAVERYEGPDDLLEAAENRMRRRQARRRATAAVLGVALSVVAGFLVWRALPTSERGGGAVDDTGWVLVGEVDELRARRIVYVDEIQTFIVAQPGEEPYALSAASPHLGDRLLFCRSSGWFFSPAHGETFDVQGNYELGPADTGMARRQVRVVEDGVEVLTGSEIPASGATAPADPEPSGPLCSAEPDGALEDEPGFAGLSGALVEPDRYPVEVVEGVTPGATIANPGFVGLEIGFATNEITVRLVGGDGSILDERSTGCDTVPCPGYAYAELIFTVDAPQRATVLIGAGDGGDIVWVHHVPVILEPEPGVEAGSFVGTWYDENGNPTYYRDAEGWHLELHVINGADHCGWQSASFLTLAWPVGSEVRRVGEGARFYVRDPEGVLAESFGVPAPNLSASLPSDAEPTGHHRGDWELWTSPSDVDERVYLVSAGGPVEAWPRVGRAIACA
jgi:Rieske Fe-S protein